MPVLTTNPTTDLDAAAPEQVARNLRHTAARYAESCSELQSAWQDDQAGKIWQDFAAILNRAADACDRAMAKRGLG